MTTVIERQIEKFDEEFGQLGTFSEDQIDLIEAAALKHIKIKTFLKDSMLKVQKQKNSKLIKLLQQAGGAVMTELYDDALRNIREALAALHEKGAESK